MIIRIWVVLPPSHQWSKLCVDICAVVKPVLLFWDGCSLLMGFGCSKLNSAAGWDNINWVSFCLLTSIPSTNRTWALNPAARTPNPSSISLSRFASLSSLFIYFIYAHKYEAVHNYNNLSYDILQDGKGNDVDLATYKGKVLLIVNVASKWYPSSSIHFILF
jgi:hypothetical protein